MEIEFYNGQFNHGSYLNHGANDSASLQAAKEGNINGVTIIKQGNYTFYTEYDYWGKGTAPTTSEQLRCVDGPYILPTMNEFICFNPDKAPGPFFGAITYAKSAQGDEIEYAAPFVGFMKDVKGNPIMALGKTIDVSISLESSPDYSTPKEWVTDTAPPINGYYLGK